MNLTSLFLGLGGGLLCGYGISRAVHEHADGWPFALLGVVLIALGLTHGQWGV